VNSNRTNGDRRNVDKLRPLAAACTFLELSEVDEFEVGLGLELEKAEDEAVGEGDLLVAVERHGEVVVVERVLERNHVVDAQYAHRPRRHGPLDRLHCT